MKKNFIKLGIGLALGVPLLLGITGCSSSSSSSDDTFRVSNPYSENIDATQSAENL